MTGVVVDILFLYRCNFITPEKGGREALGHPTGTDSEENQNAIPKSQTFNILEVSLLLEVKFQG